MTLYLEKLFNSENNKIYITGPADLKAFVVEDTFTIAGSANYESKYDKMIQGLLDSNEMAEFGLQAVKNFTGFQLKSMESTTLEYVDSERPTFDIPVIIPAYDQGQESNPLNMVKDFGAAVYPLTSGAASIISPNNYTLQDRGSGRFSISIGKWFRANYQVLKNFSFQVSKESTPRGYPLYVSGTLSFEADQLITAEDYRKYFLL